MHEIGLYYMEIVHFLVNPFYKPNKVQASKILGLNKGVGRDYCKFMAKLKT